MAEPESTAQAPQSIAILGPEHERNKELEFITDFVSLAQRKRQQYVEIWHEVMSNYLVALPGAEFYTSDDSGYRPYPPTSSSTSRGAGGIGYSQLRDPETFQIIEAAAAQGIVLALGKEYLQAVPLSPRSYDHARQLTRVVMAALEGPTNYRKLYGGFKDGNIFGTAIFELGWRKKVQNQVVKVPVFDRMGTLQGYEYQVRPVVQHDEPLLKAVDLFDFYPDSSGTRIHEDMCGVAKRYRIDKNEANDLADEEVYDREPVRRLLHGSAPKAESGASMSGDTDHRFERIGIDDRREVAGLDNALLTGFEYWGEVPYKPRDGNRNRVITVLGDEVVRSHINPLIDGLIPFKEFVMNPINGRFWGLGAAEVVRFLQDSADNLLMAINDGVDMASAIPLLVGHGFSGDLNQLRRRDPFDIISCGDVSQVAPVPFDFNAMQLAAQDLLRRKVSMREASGSVDPEALSADRQSATTSAELVRLATRRTELQVQLLERDFFPWLGKGMHSRMRQFLPTEGALAVLDGESTPFSLDDIDVDIDVRFVGSRQALSHNQKFQQYSQMLNMLVTNPQAVAMLPDIVVRMFRDGMEIDDAATLVEQAAATYKQEQERQAGLEAQMGGGGAGAGAPASQAQVATMNGAGENVARAGMALA